ncbi:MAG: methylated-DNA--[protein]-cysteine S-methyltransferase [Paramuribaculum sp.]|nr:methylated-DNA--[protein]-cysteine S-methyltransferase [Paramuribaculum sp.]
MKESKAIIVTCQYISDAGSLILGEYDGKLCLCDWINSLHAPKVMARIQRYFHSGIAQDRTPVLIAAAAQLDEYFSRKRRQFDLPLLFAGTDFQRRVWQELMNINYGSNISYMALAERLGMVTGVRAVANAVGANAMSVIVPCHRILGADGSLTGYAGGLAAKRFLLDLESDVI